MLSQGYKAAHDGAQTCTACPLGLFGANASATACQPCAPPQFYTPSVATRQCSSCNAGLYAVFENASAGVFRECRFCPEGASCPALADMSTSPLFYATRDPVTLAVDTFLCDGGRCAADFRCGANRVAAADNPLCGRCLPGHSEWGGACVACPDGADGGLVLGLLVLAWVCVLAIHGFTQRASTSSALRIAMFFWQVSLLMVDGAAWARWAGVLELNVLVSGSGSMCPFSVSPVGALALRLLGPLLPYALLAATAGVHRGLGPLRRLRLPPFQAAAYWRTAISLYFYTFNSVARACLDFFNCAALPSGRYVVAVPAVRCDEAAYRGLAPVAVLLLAAYAAAAPGWIGYRVRAAHDQESGGEFAGVWSVVYGPLHRGVFWWGLAQMLARAALVATAVYARVDASVRHAVMVLIVGVLALLSVQLKPNLSAGDNAWELGTLVSLALLAQSQNMGASDGWLAALTLGVGAAVAVRVCAQSLLRLTTGGSRAEEPSASRASARASDRWAENDGGALAGGAYVALEGNARSCV